MNAVTLRLSTSDCTFEGTVVETFFGKREDTFDVAFDGDNAPHLAVGEEAQFTVCSDTLQGDLDLLGVVRDVREQAASLRLLLACPVDDSVEVAEWEDRRGAARVKPDGGGILASISIWDGEQICDPLVNDVSATGISFMLPTGKDTLEEGALLAIGLYSESDGTIDFAARVRYRRKTGPYDLYGVEFDSELTEDLSSKQLQMHFFVERRREVLARRTSAN